MYFAHSLIKKTEGNQSFWIAASESSASQGSPQLAIPVCWGLDRHQPADELLSEYRFDYAYYSEGVRKWKEVRLLKTEEDILSLTIHGQSVLFYIHGEALPYKGQLKYPDFTARFVALEFVDEEAEEKLFSEHACLLAGCNPNRYYYPDWEEEWQFMPNKYPQHCKTNPDMPLHLQLRAIQ